VQINKIDLTLTFNLILTLFPNTNPISNPKPDANPNLKRPPETREKQLKTSLRVC